MAINMSEWAPIIKLAVALIVLICSMFGLIFFVVKWKLGTLSNGQHTLFELINDHTDRLRNLELALLATSSGDKEVVNLLTRKISTSNRKSY